MSRTDLRVHEIQFTVSRSFSKYRFITGTGSRKKTSNREAISLKICIFKKTVEEKGVLRLTHYLKFVLS